MVNSGTNRFGALLQVYQLLSRSARHVAPGCTILIIGCPAALAPIGELPLALAPRHGRLPLGRGRRCTMRSFWWCARPLWRIHHHGWVLVRCIRVWRVLHRVCILRGWARMRSTIRILYGLRRVVLLGRVWRAVGRVHYMIMVGGRREGENRAPGEVCLC